MFIPHSINKWSFRIKVINLLHLSVANPVDLFVIFSAKCKIINTFNIDSGVYMNDS